MTESDVKRQIAKVMQENNGYARRIEDQYAVGTFDMILIPKGYPVFMAEVKLIRLNIFGPSPRQSIELQRIQDAAADSGHVIPVMIGWQDGNYYFHKPQIRISKHDCFSVTTSTMNFHDQLVQYYHSIKGST